MEIFATGMRRWPARTFIDLFAGPGRCVIRETNQFLPGSPLIALGYPFTHYLYVEKNRRAVEALDKRVAPYRHQRSVVVFAGDCNAVMGKVCEKLPPRGLALAFLDPTNWQISYDTVLALTQGRRVDLIVTFMAGMMKRVPADAEVTALDAFFGTDEWRRLKARTLFEFVDLYRRQLARIGYLRQPPKVEVVVKNRKNAPLYQMAFFSKSPRGYEFWDKISLVDEHGQSSLFG